MKQEYLGSFAALLAGAGLSLAQQPAAPEVLASPAPHVRVSAVRVSLPADLPPLTDAPAGRPTNPEIFPFPGTGVYDTPDGCVTELPPYCEPVSHGPAGKGQECDAARRHVWASADPLLWWVRPGSGLARVAPDGSFDYGLQVGGRLAVGFVNAAGNLGLEGGGFWLARGTAHAAGASGPDGFPALGRPTIDPSGQLPVAVPVSGPGALVGAIAVDSSSQLWGAETNVVGNAIGCDRLGIDLLGGVRYLTLEETLALAQSGALAGGAGTYGVADSLRTRNQFIGGQLGSQVELRWGRLYTNLLGKVAVGNVHQIVDARGDSTLSGGGSAAPPAGFLGAGSGAGRLTHDEFGVLPEVNFNIGYQLRPGIRLYAGYSFLYLNDVARPGDQVNAIASPALVPATPLYGATAGSQSGSPFNHSDFWTQGVNFGLALRY